MRKPPFLLFLYLLSKTYKLYHSQKLEWQGKRVQVLRIVD